MTTVWRDPKTEAFVTAELTQPGKFIKISYLGTTYPIWSKRTREADLKGKL